MSVRPFQVNLVNINPITSPKSPKILSNQPKQVRFNDSSTNLQDIYQILNNLQTQVRQLEHENQTLKAIVALSTLNPLCSPKSCDLSQLLNLYNSKVEQFSQCMK